MSSCLEEQRDQDNNRNFDHRDKDFYNLKPDLNTLKLGKGLKWEVGNTPDKVKKMIGRKKKAYNRFSHKPRN